ncbi:hypothetical protein RZA67_15630 [Stenotrophomonas sp. C3(2023)]|uniref:hypothetical protein n=1 Tax=Stenotrophomonas sp. C3(2023) TaxID=3080277 RepID=UPI00293C49FA|nr:hypothetical protein [Stenotrophomonas sp. C3(2023)]MDV3470154.1 hypothetical protein [Stenotrophomonas sp. C3(2023)]
MGTPKKDAARRSTTVQPEEQGAFSVIRQRAGPRSRLGAMLALARRGHWNSDTADLVWVALLRLDEWPADRGLVVHDARNNAVMRATPGGHVVHDAGEVDPERDVIVQYDGSHYNVASATLTPEGPRFEIVEHIAQDGDCLFNAVLNQVPALRRTSDADQNVQALRDAVVTHLIDHRDQYRPFMPEDDDRGELRRDDLDSLRLLLRYDRGARAFSCDELRQMVLELADLGPGVPHRADRASTLWSLLGTWRDVADAEVMNGLVASAIQLAQHPAPGGVAPGVSVARGFAQAVALQISNAVCDESHLERMAAAGEPPAPPSGGRIAEIMARGIRIGNARALLGYGGAGERAPAGSAVELLLPVRGLQAIQALVDMVFRKVPEILGDEVLETRVSSSRRRLFGANARPLRQVLAREQPPVGIYPQPGSSYSLNPVYLDTLQQGFDSHILAQRGEVHAPGQEQSALDAVQQMSRLHAQIAEDRLQAYEDEQLSTLRDELIDSLQREGAQQRQWRATHSEVAMREMEETVGALSAQYHAAPAETDRFGSGGDATRVTMTPALDVEAGTPPASPAPHLDALRVRADDETARQFIDDLAGVVNTGAMAQGSPRYAALMRGVARLLDHMQGDAAPLRAPLRTILQGAAGKGGDATLLALDDACMVIDQQERLVSARDLPARLEIATQDFNCVMLDRCAREQAFYQETASEAQLVLRARRVARAYGRGLIGGQNLASDGQWLGEAELWALTAIGEVRGEHGSRDHITFIYQHRCVADLLPGGFIDRITAAFNRRDEAISELPPPALLQGETPEDHLAEVEQTQDYNEKALRAAAQCRREIEALQEEAVRADRRRMPAAADAAAIGLARTQASMEGTSTVPRLGGHPRAQDATEATQTGASAPAAAAAARPAMLPVTLQTLRMRGRTLRVAQEHVSAAVEHASAASAIREAQQTAQAAWRQQREQQLQATFDNLRVSGQQAHDQRRAHLRAEHRQVMQTNAEQAAQRISLERQQQRMASAAHLAARDAVPVRGAGRHPSGSDGRQAPAVLPGVSTSTLMLRGSQRPGAIADSAAVRRLAQPATRALQPGTPSTPGRSGGGMSR